LTLNDFEGHWQPVRSAILATAGLLVWLAIISASFLCLILMSFAEDARQPESVKHWATAYGNRVAGRIHWLSRRRCSRHMHTSVSRRSLLVTTRHSCSTRGVVNSSSTLRRSSARDQKHSRSDRTAFAGGRPTVCGVNRWCSRQNAQGFARDKFWTINREGKFLLQNVSQQLLYTSPSRIGVERLTRFGGVFASARDGLFADKIDVPHFITSSWPPDLPWVNAVDLTQSRGLFYLRCSLANTVSKVQFKNSSEQRFS